MSRFITVQKRAPRPGSKAEFVVSHLEKNLETPAAEIAAAWQAAGHKGGISPAYISMLRCQRRKGEPPGKPQHNLHTFAREKLQDDPDLTVNDLMAIWKEEGRGEVKKGSMRTAHLNARQVVGHEREIQLTDRAHEFLRAYIRQHPHDTAYQVQAAAKRAGHGYVPKRLIENKVGAFRRSNGGDKTRLTIPVVIPQDTLLERMEDSCDRMMHECLEVENMEDIVAAIRALRRLVIKRMDT